MFNKAKKGVEAQSDKEFKDMMVKIDNCIEKIIKLMGDDGLSFRDSTIVPERLQTILNGLKFDTAEYKECKDLEEKIYAKSIAELYQASIHPNSDSPAL